MSLKEGLNTDVDQAVRCVDESWHTWMSHVTSERVMSLIKEGLTEGVDEAVRCVDGHVMSHMWMSHVTHMDESLHV